MKAIETKYEGYRFRSRLEARWAVFFDALGLQWDYEPQGFEFENGVRYLCDFYIAAHPQWFRGLPMYLEVKPCDPTEKELLKVKKLAEGTNVSACIVSGPPGSTMQWFTPAGTKLIWDGSNPSPGFLAAMDASRSARFEHGEKPNTGFVGLFFLSYRNGKVHEQGRVVKRLPGGNMLVQLYSWISGEATSERIASPEEQRTWRTYGTLDTWHEAAALSWRNEGLVL